MRLGTNHTIETIEKLIRTNEADVRYQPNTNHGYCMCGCMNLAPLAKRTNMIHGHLKGKPLRYIPGHQRRGTKLTEEHKLQILKSHLGRINSEETKSKMRASAHRGSNNSQWLGGISTERNKARNTPEQIQWRKDVQERDNYICQECNLIGCKLHSHHVKSFAKYPELRTVLENGITWCEECHYDWHKKNGFH